MLLMMIMMMMMMMMYRGEDNGTHGDVDADKIDLI